MNKLPIDKPASTEHDSYNNIQHIQPPHKEHTVVLKPLEQYEIPHDPPPPSFRPLPISPSYGVPQAPPISSITHTQIITTAYGAPITDFQQSPTLVDNNNNKWNDVPIGPGVSQVGIDSDQLNMYHVMSLKKGNNAHHTSFATTSHQSFDSPPSESHVPSNYINSHETNDGHDYHHYSPSQNVHKVYGPPPRPSHQQQPPPPPPSIGGHRPQRTPSSHEQIINSLGPGYEIQKSIGFELKGTPLQVGQRRLIKVRKPKQQQNKLTALQ